MSRIAVVDVGTNTTRLFVAEVRDQRVTAELHRESRVTRLGAGVDRTGRLSEEALAREHAVLADYRDKIEAHKADRAVAVMTSAVRDAANGREFADAAADRYGLDVHVLSGDEEAKLTYRGATDELPSPADPAPAHPVDPTDPGDPAHPTEPAHPAPRVLVLDIGGGSTELVTGRGRDPDFHVSTQAGVVRQADRHIEHDPPTDQELEAVARDVRETIGAAVAPERRRGVDLAIAVAGTPTSLAAIAQDLDPYDPAKVHGYRLSAATRDRLLARLAPMPVAQRRQVTGLHPDRAPTIVPGIVILREVMRLFDLQEVQVSEHDILRGAALAFAG